MKKIILAGSLALIVAAVVVAHMYFGDRGRWTTEPEFTGLARQIVDGELISGSDPAVAMRFAPSFRHIGGQKFVLYGVADTEQHFFVETGDEDKLKSLYWIQFEAYRPDNSYRYDYEDSPLRQKFGDYDFYVDTAAVQSNPAKRRRGTDGALARAFVQSKGYAFPKDFSYARLVHLTDESRRKELMIIFIEDLAPLGLSATDVQENGREAGRWTAIEKAHLEKISRSMTLVAPGSGAGL